MRSGRILVTQLIGLGVIGAIVTGQEAYSRLLYLGVLIVLAGQEGVVSPLVYML